MDKKIRLLLILNLTSLVVLLFLFTIGIAYGISITGRFFERLLLVLFIVSLTMGLIISKEARSNFVYSAILPVIVFLALFFLSPIGGLHLTGIIVFNSLNAEKVYYETDSFKVVKGMSLMTDNLYEIKSKHIIYEKLEAQFQTGINLENTQIEYNDSLVEILTADSIYKIEIEN
ncbi:hypothetical protein [Putridiphycobacter roseus]|nr:hypothetical protein [Putridiphycobacter roseus]